MDSAAAPGGDGSAGSPLRSVQAAIAAAADGSTIQVRAGTYDENVAVVDKTVILHGGFPAAGDFSQRDPAANPTILAGIGGDSVVTLLRAGATVVDGFVITNGTGKPATDQSEGGGVYVMGGSTTISNNLIENNSTDAGVNDSAGGGIFVQSAAGFSIEGNIIRNNVSSVGAGIDITDTSGDITENLIENNDARGFGGGFFLGDGADVVVFRNILRGNTATTSGLGIGGGGYIEGTATTAILQFNRVTDNQAARHGSGYYAKEAMVDFLGELLHDNRCPEQGDGTGIWVDVGADVLVENATIADHPCPTTFQAQAILVDSADLVVRNSILWNNQGGDVGQGDPSNIVITYTINQSDHPGQGNQNDADPLFAAPADQDYHVRSIGGRYDPVTGMDVTDATSSPAIDAGDPASSVDLEPAPNGGIRNLGAYGGTEEASRSDP